MAAGEVLLSGTQLDDGTTNSHASAPNVLDANGITQWSTSPGAAQGWVGIDAGAACLLTRVRLSPNGGYEDGSLNATMQAANEATFSVVSGVAFAQGKANHINGTNNASVTANFTNAQTAGNTNVIFVGFSASAVISGVTDTSGNTYNLVSGPSGSVHLSCYVASNILAATAGANTVTVAFSVNSDFPDIHALEYSNIVASPFDAASNNSGTGTAVDSGNLTTTNANDILICYLAGSGSPVTTAGSGFTLRLTEASWDGSSEDKVVVATGTYSGSFTTGTSVNWQCKCVALKASGAPSPLTFASVSARPVTGTLLNEYSASSLGGSLYRYFRFNGSTGNFGAIADLDFIAQYTSGVVASAVAPTIAPPGGQYDLPVVVTLSSITTDAALWYTIDGTTPSAGGGTSVKYTGPFVINSTATLQVIAVSANVSNSRITSAKFYVPSAFVSTDNPIDNRGYPFIARINPYYYLDPVSQYWYCYTQNVDNPGVATFGYTGFDVYRSGDMRNWTYRANVLGPGAGLAKNYAHYQGRPAILYNAANSNYVMYVNGDPGSGSAGKCVYTATSIEGPWTFVANYLTIEGLTANGDHSLFLDTDGVTAYLLFGISGGGGGLHITRLTSNYQTSDGTNNITLSQAAVGGNTCEAPHLVNYQGYYYMMCSSYSQWKPNLNYYLTSSASNPLSGWAYQGNPFQVSADANSLGQAGTFYGLTVSQSNTIAYNTQVQQLLPLPSRRAVIYVGDRFETGLGPSTGSSTTANFQAHRAIILPVSFPSPGAMSIGWLSSWSLESTFPHISGSAAAPSGLAVSGSTATWINNESNPHNIYLDTSSDAHFVQNSASQVLTPGSTSATLLATRAYYRVRAVNVNGTSTSPFVTVVAPVRNIPQAYTWTNSYGTQSEYSFAAPSVMEPPQTSNKTPGVPFHVPDAQTVLPSSSFVPAGGNGLVICGGAGAIQYNINGTWVTVATLTANQAFYVMADGANVQWNNPTGGSLIFTFYRELSPLYPSFK